MLALEIGNEQYTKVSKILSKNKFKTKYLVKDYRENIRCILSTLESWHYYKPTTNIWLIIIIEEEVLGQDLKRITLEEEAALWTQVMVAVITTTVIWILIEMVQWPILTM